MYIYIIYIYNIYIKPWGFPGGTRVKNLPANAGDTKNTVLVPQSGWSPGEGNSNQLQSSCLENPMDRVAWWTIVHGVTKKSDTTEWTHTCMHTHNALYDVSSLTHTICLLHIHISHAICVLSISPMLLNNLTYSVCSTFNPHNIFMSCSIMIILPSEL